MTNAEKTNTPNVDTLHSQMSAEGRLLDREDYTKEITNEPIEETPFRLIGVKKKYFIAYGAKRVTTDYQTREEALKAVEKRDWSLILTMVVAIMSNIERDRIEGETIEEMLDRTNIEG